MRKEFINPFETWRPWFAWRPVFVGWTMVWLETVERKLRSYGQDQVWEYRFVS